MKAKLLLAALALPVVFSACNQDELVTNGVEKEAVGTPIGYLEFAASYGDATTRLGNAGWEVGDKIGMGWISGDAGLSATANLYSNHPIYCKDSKGSFKSETMIYEGLYIASFPFQLTQKVAPLSFDLSEQTSENSYLAGRWHVSSTFINLDEKSAGMGNASAITLAPLTNLMKLNIKLKDGAVVPEGFKVTGVTLTDAGSKLANKLTLASDDGAVVAGNTTLATACWTAEKGNIKVQVGEEGVGSSIDAKNGLDVFFQMGAFASDDATTITIHTNYGDAPIVSGSETVSWSSTALTQTTAAKVDDFAAAVKAMNSKASGKEYGQNVAVNVTLDEANIDIPKTVSSQADLDKIITLLDKMGKLADKNTTKATIEFAKSELKVKDGVAVDGDVILTDLSGLNKLGGAIEFKKSVSGAPTNVYVAGELALQTKPTITSVDFTILKGQTLTISKDVDLTSAGITINAGATLVNKAKVTTTGTVTTIAAVTGENPVPAGLYISEVGADASAIGTFANGGEIQWKAGKLLASMTGTLYANVATATDMVNASDAFNDVTTATKEIIIANDLTIATQLTKTELPGIVKMTIKGNVAFGLGLAEAFTFDNLTAIDVKSGSFSLTGGDSGKGYFAFTAGNCTLTLAKDTKLNLAAGTKLDLGTGTVSYTGATITNNGYIVATSASGTGVWDGNAVNENPKK